MALEIKSLLIADLVLDVNNARQHPQKNMSAIKKSLDTFGQRKPIVITKESIVVAGNGTLTAAIELGWKDIDVVYVPDNWTPAQIKAFAIADNRSAELAEWDTPILLEQLAYLQAEDWHISTLGFLIDDVELLKGITKENPYTPITNIPHYEITGKNPPIQSLFNSEKTDLLKAKISNADIPAEIKNFLTLAATRHTVFQYGLIAEFYAHANKEVQELMEESALVIIDYDSAIANGYVKFSTTLAELEDNDSENQ